MYLLCCILHIFKNKDMSSTVAAALFHQPDYPDKKQGTPNGYSSKHDNSISENECSSTSAVEQSNKFKPDCLSAILNDCLSPSDCCQGNTPRYGTVADCFHSTYSDTLIHLGCLFTINNFAMGGVVVCMDRLDSVEVVLRHLHRHCYRSSPLWFIVGGTKTLVCSS
jgi:hypothetical protein